MTNKTLLLVEDDVSLRYAIESFLSQQGQYEIKLVGDFQTAQETLDKSKFDIVLTDVKMPGGSGFDLLKQVKKQNPETVVIVMTAYGTIEQAVEAMKHGAYDFLVKPFQLSTLDTVLASAVNAVETGAVSEKLPAEDVQRKGEKVFITNNMCMKDLIENLKKVAASKATVLVQGESGTGKEVLAHMVHNFSMRRGKAFVAINCAALPDNLLESELFGHEKGSFTGAIQRQIGKFELSDGGTILLDEISEMSLSMQTKLLRVLQECEVYRIGGNKPIPINLRVVASTNRDLYKYMKDGYFREDLYYRINVIPIIVPPLRERGDDVLVLANHFLDEFSHSHDRPRIVLDELATHKVLTYPWYGNVRELRNAMERAILVGNFEQLGNELSANYSMAKTISEPAAQPTELSETKSHEKVDGEMTLDEVEKRVIYETLRRCGGNRTRTAEKLGISLRTLRNKLKAFKDEDTSLVAE